MGCLLDLLEKVNLGRGEKHFSSQSEFHVEEFVGHQRQIEDQRDESERNDDPRDIGVALLVFQTFLSQGHTSQFVSFFARGIRGEAKGRTSRDFDTAKDGSHVKEKKNEPSEINENVRHFGEDMIDLFDLRDDQWGVHVDGTMLNLGEKGIGDQLDRGRSENTANDQKGKDEDHRQTTTDLAEHRLVLTVETGDQMHQTDEKKNRRTGESEGSEEEGQRTENLMIDQIDNGIAGQPNTHVDQTVEKITETDQVQKKVGRTTTSTNEKEDEQKKEIEENTGT